MPEGLGWDHEDWNGIRGTGHGIVSEGLAWDQEDWDVVKGTRMELENGNVFWGGAAYLSVDI